MCNLHLRITDPYQRKVAPRIGPCSHKVSSEPAPARGNRPPVCNCPLVRCRNQAARPFRSASAQSAQRADECPLLGAKRTLTTAAYKLDLRVHDLEKAAAQSERPDEMPGLLWDG